MRDEVKSPIRDLAIKRVEDACEWTNSAQSIDELYEDEQRVKESFISVVEQIASVAHGKMSFGPQNCNVTKTRESIQSKVDRAKVEGASEKFAVKHVDDGVRGTIIFKNMQSLRKGFETFERVCQELGVAYDVSNLWDMEEDYAGYLDIDVRILLPFDGNRRTILAELQFHLDSFYDGTPDSVVARAHKVYEIIRMMPVLGKSECGLSQSTLMDVSRLYFTAALFTHLTRIRL